MADRPTQVRTLRTIDALRQHLTTIDTQLPCDDLVDPAGALATPIGDSPNRFAILPMEGWDGTEDGRPTDLMLRRWRRFGTSGAGMIWGGEAAAVRADGRANPNQLVVGGHIADLRAELGAAQHVGLQLTHSGRWSHDGALCATEHPLLDGRRSGRILRDDELDDIVGAFVDAAVVAQRAGFHFVDVKHCHGYLAHELLGGVDRPGRYGGDLDGRTRFLFSCIDGIRAAAPGLEIGVRLSAFDVVPHSAGDDGVGAPEAWGDGPYRHAFGGDGSGIGIDLTEPIALVRRLADAGVRLISVTAGSPYWCPHVQRPAYFPPSDGYLPPEDPLVGVVRLLAAARTIKEAVPDAVVVGTGYSYLQQWIAHVGQATVREDWVDLVGLGRMALSYPSLPADVLAGRPLEARHICRTFSDCTTAPRNGLVSGCWPLDDEYKRRPDRAVLVAAKRRSRLVPSDDDEDDER